MVARPWSSYLTLDLSVTLSNDLGLLGSDFLTWEITVATSLRAVVWAQWAEPLDCEW